ncbi:TonB-dependent receptor [Hymenobacter jejuensis]|uniref:TonB-dependent receptor n=1 Tax=Hymenobacter jejuensis TaxID=2502781 RepID=A0A5B8A3S7_9BACT|nr:TonB-dependent receptor [Hymenobacter jejuensis]QDA60832.1 TonB-dependent receptor [Hymenobacter jejuensis]
MKKVLGFGAALLALPLTTAWAQGPVSGSITDARTGAALPGASIVLDGTATGAATDASGAFTLPAVPAGAHELRISFIGYRQLVQAVQGQPAAQQVRLALAPADFVTGEAVVTATRANEKTGTTYTNVSNEQLQARNFGQDLPYLLDQTPSVVVNSDGGTGVGYTGIRVRGTDNTRINVTLNGVPVNEAESHGVFFVDLPDLASSVQSIQVQRGVGTSTNGAGAFGASLNVETTGLRTQPYADVNNSAGSYGTWKSTIAAGTGLINSHFTLDARVSRLQSEGYVDRSASRLGSLYLAGTYSGKNTLVRAMVLTGREKTGQAWYGLADSLLTKKRRLNEAGTDYGQHFPAYRNQTDNYQQDYYQLLVSHQFGPNWNLSVTPFWTRGGGYYEEYKVGQDFAKYGISGPVYAARAAGGLDTITSTDVIRRRWLKTDLYGATYSLQYRPETGRLTELTLGGATIGYRGQHFDELTWAQYGLNIPESGYRYYSEPNALKTDANGYARAVYQLAEPLSAFVDLQYRYVKYTFFGPLASGEKGQQSTYFHFFNPKAGLTYILPHSITAYASYAVAQREPTRTDYTDTPAERRPVSEKLQNVEAGLRRNAGVFQWSANYYLMLYRNQLVLSGKLDDVGNPIHNNVRDSYRTGVELTSAAQVAKQLTISANATFSRNKIKNYIDYLADYDNGGEAATRYRETDISFSPAVIVGNTLEYQPVSGLRLAVLSKYVGKQYLDNTASNDRSIDSYFVNDLRLRYAFQPGKLGLRNVEVALLVNNIFSTRYESNGYTYGYIEGGQAQYFNYHYPQAPRNFLASLNLHF